MSKFITNQSGEYCYQFTFKNEHGETTGFNTMWGKDKQDAYRKAVNHFNHKPYDHAVFGHIEGLYVCKDSMKKQTREMSDELNRQGWLMSI